MAPWSLAPTSAPAVGEALAHRLELVERRHLPGDVVHADGPLPGLAGAGAVADREEGDVVVVVGRGRAHEHERARRGRSITVEKPSTSA